MKDYKNVNENIRMKIREIKYTRIDDDKLAQKMEDMLIISLAYLVHSIVYKYKRFDNYEDLYQEGMLGLIKAVRQYNSDTSFHFTRYALWWIKARVMRSIKKLNLINVHGDDKMQFFIQYDISENELIDDNDPEKNVILSQRINNLYNALETLPEKSKQIINLRYGLRGNDKSNLQELGDRLDMTREGIRQLEHRILNKLKNDNNFND